MHKHTLKMCVNIFYLIFILFNVFFLFGPSNIKAKTVIFVNADGLAKDGTISGVYSEFAIRYHVNIQRVMLESKFKIPFAVAKQTKHGPISLVLSMKHFKTDLTVCVDVSSNPGPQICSGISELDKSSCDRGQSCSMNTPSTRYNHVNRFRWI